MKAKVEVKPVPKMSKEEREAWKRLNPQVAAQIDERLQKVKADLAREFGQDIADAMMPDVK